MPEILNEQLEKYDSLVKKIQEKYPLCENPKWNKMTKRHFKKLVNAEKKSPNISGIFLLCYII